MKVKEIMTKKVTTVGPEETVEKIFFTFNTKNIRHLPVLEKGKLVGIISDRDIKRIMPKKPRKIMRPDGKSYTMIKDALHKGEVLLMRSGTSGYVVGPLKAKSIMQPKVVTISLDEEAANAAMLMVEKKISCLPVMEKDGSIETMIGIVTAINIMEAFVKLLKEGK